MIVLGANSEVAQAFVEHALKAGEKYKTLYLLSSNPDTSEKFANHIYVKYLQHTKVINLDLTKEIDYKTLENIESDVLFCASGFLGLSTADGLYDDKNTQRVIDINFAKLVPVINFFAKKMESKRHGHIIALSSVAGERGRQSNFIYGSAKAALTAYLSGLRNYLTPKNVHVMTVKPGFMATKMTEGLPLNPALTATPKQAAKCIYNAFKKKKDVAFVLPIWFLIMMIIRNIPEFIFKKLKL